jgi:opacity protein-like surface antigen
MKNASAICAAIFLISYNSLQAQVKGSPYEIGFHLGTALYAGDLTPNLKGSYKTPGKYFGFTGAKILNDAFTLRANISFGKIRASDANFSKPAYRQLRNFGFKSSITEFSVNMNWNVLGNQRRLIPYLTAGVGYTFLKIRKDISNFDVEYFSATEPNVIEGLAQDAAHKLPKGIGTIPVGAGLRYALTEKLSLTTETTYRLMSTDYLDGFSQAADPEKKDHYFTHTIGIVYSFGKKNTLACPKK